MTNYTEMNETTHERLKKIKQSFRLVMNGEASHSMREKGLDYKINWGVSLMQLRQMAQECGKDYDLAVCLWKEDIRECKILATLTMPAEEFLPDMAELWMEQTRSQEMAEMAAFNLYQHLDYAPVLVYKWIAAADDIRQICGYQLLSRLFMKGQEPNERGMNEFLDQAMAALQSGSAGVRHAAATCVQRLAMLGPGYATVVDKAMRPLINVGGTDGE